MTFDEYRAAYKAWRDEEARVKESMPVRPSTMLTMAMRVELSAENDTVDVVQLNPQPHGVHVYGPRWKMSEARKLRDFLNEILPPEPA